MLETLAKRIREKNFDQKNLFDSCVGSLQYNERRWVVDIDNYSEDLVNNIANAINRCHPYDKNKIIAEIQTRNGVHLITEPFNIKQFQEKGYSDIEIQKCNPTLLYYPNSLD